MDKLIRVFLDQLTARLVPTVASLVAYCLDSLRLLLVAEKQAELEEAAKRYESLGLHEIAAKLRTGSAALDDNDPARGGVQLLENVAGTREVVGTEQTPRLKLEGSEPPQPAKPRRKRPTDLPQEETPEF